MPIVYIGVVKLNVTIGIRKHFGQIVSLRPNTNIENRESIQLKRVKQLLKHQVAKVTDALSRFLTFQMLCVFVGG